MLSVELRDDGNALYRAVSYSSHRSATCDCGTLKCGWCSQKKQIFKVYLINLHFNSHMRLVATILDTRVLKHRSMQKHTLVFSLSASHLIIS